MEIINKKIMAISGSVAAGKTTVADIYSAITGYAVQYEEFENNPYLEKFYENPEKYSFQTQMWFLGNRFRDFLYHCKTTKNIILDRFLHEDIVFAKTAVGMNILSSIDYAEIYKPAYEHFVNYVRLPDLVIFLDVSFEVSKERLKKRNRAIEKNINFDYLKSLTENYKEWINDYKGKKIIINTDNLDLTNGITKEWIYFLKQINNSWE